MDNLLKVIEKSKKIIFGAIKTQERNNISEKSLNVDDDIIPIEFFMNIPNRMKSHKFYQDANIGDVVICYVTRIYQNRLEANLICTAATLKRDIEPLKITAICRAHELPVVSNFSSIKAFRCSDKIKAIITKITRNECLEISMNELSPMNKHHQTDLGLVSDENLPSYFKICQGLSSNESYYNDAFSLNELSISMDIKNKLDYYNISNNGFSLLDSVNEIKITENETAKNMRSALLMKESMKYVVKGVNYYKNKQLNEALQCYNHALSINEANVDALVARGALRASSKSFELSIEDLEKAVKINPHHKNAALYLSQTIVAYKKTLPEENTHIALDILKTIHVTKDESKSKTIIDDITDPNKFIIITDENTSDSSDSSKSRRKRKSKKSKKLKYKMSKKTIVLNSSSSEERSRPNRHHSTSQDSSSDSTSHNRSRNSANDLNKRKRKRSYTNDHSRHNKIQCISSSESDNSTQKKTGDRSENRSKHSLDRTSFREKIFHRMHNDHSFLNSSVSSIHKRKFARDLSSDRSIDSNQQWQHDWKLPRYLNRSFKDDINAQSWSIRNNNGNNAHSTLVTDKIKYTTNNNHTTSVNQISKDHDKNNDCTSSMPDLIPSCDRENLKLKKANEDIKQIEDFMSSLRQSVPL